MGTYLADFRRRERRAFPLIGETRHVGAANRIGMWRVGDGAVTPGGYSDGV